ncbi:hypothetical protein [Aliivibrio fischeri]|uniref:hypothetical protein n=1 Tax=Aliivibrio fischeri TaxID=668 RepID=UPI0007C5C0CB|nr:hypothetical protein [Aliivibrio fischeri]MCE7555257.1 hypothetical protein [Aliivibrio fischeri]MCE7562525.1 hypothetical protein [Aliivibrio fischeri]MCE7565969.1 hypothetical protein [Aliivibrio fischeri]MCE7569933.1 hypothetical protein [Aliivibrio fischeri]TDM51971.1 hypothetical protein VFFQA001_17875 [Aliivibrio fischeri]
MTQTDVFLFIDSCPQPTLLTTIDGIMVYSNSSYKEQFYQEKANQLTPVIDNIIESSTEPLIQANALYCKFLESLFLKNKKTTIKKELFYYKQYVTLRTIVSIDCDDYILLMISEEK